VFDAFFGDYYVTRAIEAVGKLPKEAVYAGAAYFVITDIHRRYSQVQLEKVKAGVQVAKLEVEALRLKRELQKNGTKIYQA
jgi:hypothetical protein